DAAQQRFIGLVGEALLTEPAHHPHGGIHHFRTDTVTWHQEELVFVHGNSLLLGFLIGRSGFRLRAYLFGRSGSRLRSQIQGCWMCCCCSKDAILSSVRMVRPISSQPLSRHCLRNSSTSKWITPPSGPRISCFSRSTEITALAPRIASSINLSTSDWGSLMG